MLPQKYCCIRQSGLKLLKAGILGRKWEMVEFLELQEMGMEVRLEVLLQAVVDVHLGKGIKINVKYNNQSQSVLWLCHHFKKAA